MNSDHFTPLERRLDSHLIEDILTEQSIMPRTQTITDERLLQAARAEFLEHGINVTSAAIARRAGVSPGILFHRFGSKEALFAAAMNVENEHIHCLRLVPAPAIRPSRSRRQRDRATDADRCGRVPLG